MRQRLQALRNACDTHGLRPCGLRGFCAGSAGLYLAGLAGGAVGAGADVDCDQFHQLMTLRVHQRAPFFGRRAYGDV